MGVLAFDCCNVLMAGLGSSKLACRNQVGWVTSDSFSELQPRMTLLTRKEVRGQLLGPRTHLHSRVDGQDRHKLRSQGSSPGIIICVTGSFDRPPTYFLDSSIKGHWSQTTHTIAVPSLSFLHATTSKTCIVFEGNTETGRKHPTTTDKPSYPSQFPIEIPSR
jgi:hypothetical protein